VIVAFFIVFISSLFLFTKIPSNIMPDMLNRYNEIMIHLESGVTLSEKEEIVEAISNELQDIQDVETNYIIDNGLMLFALINMTKGDDITREQSDVNDDIYKALEKLKEDYPIDSVLSATSFTAGYPV